MRLFYLLLAVVLALGIFVGFALIDHSSDRARKLLLDRQYPAALTAFEERYRQGDRSFEVVGGAAESAMLGGDPDKAFLRFNELLGMAGADRARVSSRLRLLARGSGRLVEYL